MQTGFKSVYQTTINAPTEKVWQALTDASIVKQYFFGSNMKTDWKVGSPVLFTGEYEGQTYTDKGTVLEYEPNKRLSFSYLSSWSNLPDETNNYLQVTYEVQPESQGTQLTVTQTNYDEERAKHSQQSWAVVIDELKKIVE